jgi:hypothetical protein
MCRRSPGNETRWMPLAGTLSTCVWCLCAWGSYDHSKISKLKPRKPYNKVTCLQPPWPVIAGDYIYVEVLPSSVLSRLSSLPYFLALWLLAGILHFYRMPFVFWRSVLFEGVRIRERLLSEFEKDCSCRSSSGFSVTCKQTVADVMSLQIHLGRP